MNDALTRRREGGQVLVLFAFALVGLLAMVALVLDGGYLYVQRRTAQMAADAAALAATGELSRATSPTGDTSIGSAICTYIQANSFGITPTVTNAYFVDLNASQISGYPIALPTACGGTGGSTAIPWGSNGASGIHVDVNIPFRTVLAGMLGVANITATASSTAQIGVGTAGDARNAPFIVCGGGAGAALRWSDITTPPVSTSNGNLVNTPAALPTFGNGSNGPNVTPEILLATPAQGQPTMPAFYGNPSYDGHVYYIKGQNLGTNGNNGDCSVTGFKGGANPTQTPTDDWVNLGSGTPVVMVDLQGNKVPQINGQATNPGACAAGTDANNWGQGNPGCVMWLPIANGGNTPLLDVQAWGAFYVWCARSSGGQCQEFAGQFLANWKSGGPAVNAWRAGQGGGSMVLRLTQ